MTVSHRKHKQVTKPVEDTSSSSAPAPATAVPGVQWHCDGCGSDITLTVRIRCAGECQNFDLCGSCFCSGTETARHKAWHDYRVIEQHSYPIFSADWGADEELLLIDGCQTYGLGNWADIADHIGNRTKEEVERHYLDVYIYGKDGTEAGERRAQAFVAEAQRKGVHAPPAGPNMDYVPDVTPEEFRQRKRRRIEKLRDSQAAYVPPKLNKPLVSQPTHHSEIAGFMPGRLEFEYEYEHEAENLIKDLEFGRVYKYGGDLIPGDKDVAEAATAAIAASISGAAASDARTQRTGQVVSLRGAAPSANKNDGSGAPTGDGDVSMDVADGDSQAAPSSLPASQATGAATTGDASQSVPNGASTSAPTTAAGTAAAEGAENDNAAASTTAAASGEPPVDDKTPDWDEDEADVELKLTILQMYNERLDRRARKKDFIFERNLVDYKKNTTAERRKSKEEREILLRVKHFAQMQTPMDFEDLLNGLAYEEALRKLTLQLQHYRSVGITSLADAAEYDRERAERTKRAAAMAENGIAAFPAAGVFGTFPTSGSRGLITAANRQQRHREQSTASFTDDTPIAASTPVPAAVAAAAPAKEKPSATANGGAPGSGHTGPNGRRNSASSGDKIGRKPPKPLDLSDAPSLNLLSEAEKELCSILRIKPEPYLVIKKTILVEHIRRKGHLSRRECRQLLQIDVNKVGKIWDLLHEQGFLDAAQKAGLGAKGVGALPPPGTAASLNKPGQGFTGIPKALANGVLPPRMTNGSAPLRNQPNGTASQVARSGAAVNGANGLENGRMKRGQLGGGGGGGSAAGSPSPFGSGSNGNGNANGLAGSPPAYLGSPTKGATPIQHASPYRPTAAV